MLIRRRVRRHQRHCETCWVANKHSDWLFITLLDWLYRFLPIIDETFSALFMLSAADVASSRMLLSPGFILFAWNILVAFSSPFFRWGWTDVIYKTKWKEQWRNWELFTQNAANRQKRQICERANIPIKTKRSHKSNNTNLNHNEENKVEELVALKSFLKSSKMSLAMEIEKLLEEKLWSITKSVDIYFVWFRVRLCVNVLCLGSSRSSALWSRQMAEKMEKLSLVYCLWIFSLTSITTSSFFVSVNNWK